MSSHIWQASFTSQIYLTSEETDLPDDLVNLMISLLVGELFLREMLENYLMLSSQNCVR
jgi:hypothetical protein